MSFSSYFVEHKLGSIHQLCHTNFHRGFQIKNDLLNSSFAHKFCHTKNNNATTFHAHRTTCRDLKTEKRHEKMLFTIFPLIFIIMCVKRSHHERGLASSSKCRRKHPRSGSFLCVALMRRLLFSPCDCAQLTFCQNLFYFMKSALTATFHNDHLDSHFIIQGGLGQLGTACAQLLRAKYGQENVILSDIIKPSQQIADAGPYIFADILDFKGLQKAVVTHRIDWVIHFSALLSAIGEQNVSLAVRVNIEGMHNMIELAKQYKLRIFVPSTIGAFGPVS